VSVIDGGTLSSKFYGNKFKLSRIFMQAKLRGRGMMFSTSRSFVCPFYQTCKHNILKMNELILIQIGISDHEARA